MTKTRLITALAACITLSLASFGASAGSWTIPSSAGGGTISNPLLLVAAPSCSQRCQGQLTQCMGSCGGGFSPCKQGCQDKAKACKAACK